MRKWSVYAIGLALGAIILTGCASPPEAPFDEEMWANSLENGEY